MVVEGFPIWASKPAALVWTLKLSSLRFVGCATKPMEEGRRGTRVKI
jgi:hypothetical protein